jgi:hypothetical protein
MSPERVIGSIRRECLDHLVAIPQVGGRAAIRAVWSNQIPNFVIH